MKKEIEFFLLGTMLLCLSNQHEYQRRCVRPANSGPLRLGPRTAGMLSDYPPHDMSDSGMSYLTASWIDGVPSTYPGKLQKIFSEQVPWYLCVPHMSKMATA